MPLVFLVLYIVIEIALFIWIGGMIGVGWTLLWVLAGFVIGIAMLRRGGTKSREWLQAASQGRNEGGITKQIYWYIGGLLVILPGFFTDALGFMLVFPPTQAIVTWIFSLFIPPGAAEVWGMMSTASGFQNSQRFQDATVIDAEAEEIVEPSGEIENPRKD